MKKLAVFLILLFVTGCSPSTSIPRGPYYRLTMRQSDGSEKVFIGKTPDSRDGKAFWYDKNGVFHYFVGPHTIEEVSSYTFDNFGVKAEKEVEFLK